MALLLGSEEAPLLADTTSEPHDALYRRFTPAQKTAIVWLVSACGLIPLFVTGTFTPVIPQVAKDLHTTQSVINLAISISAFATSIGGLWGGTYSTFYGRKVVYLVSLPLLALGSIFVASSQSVASLLFWRFFQSVGASPGLVVGAGVIGDVCKLEERGNILGIFFAGPAIAPVAGGVASYIFSWRIMQGLLGLLSFLTWCIMYAWFPETSHPGGRGIDKLPNDDPMRKKIFVFLNPLRPMWLLRSPTLLGIGVRYNIANDALVGACFVPAGLGNITGAKLVGKMSDRTVIEWIQKRGGLWSPEDRLRAASIPLGIIAPTSLILFALANRYVDGTPGLVLCLFFLYLNGIGIEMAFGPCSAYLVDVMHSRSAESLAANGALRSVFMAATIAVVLPMINTLGIVMTHVVAACLIWLSFSLLWYMIWYGDRMRAYVDVGFSTADNN